MHFCGKRRLPNQDPFLFVIHTAPNSHLWLKNRTVWGSDDRRAGLEGFDIHFNFMVVPKRSIFIVDFVLFVLGEMGRILQGKRICIDT